MNCTQLNQIKISEILQRLGYQPIKKSQNEKWFLSPFREESEASFKVNTIGNVWFDHGAGIGGRTVDFICNYFDCTVKEALAWAKDQNFNFSIHQQKKTEQKDNNCEIIRTKPLRNQLLLNYLRLRKIRIEIATKYCKEVVFTIKDKNQFAIGFINESEGFEVRNKYLKLCIGKKDISYIKNGSETCVVFEGFIDFLSYLSLWPEKNIDADFIILNSVSMTYRAIEILQKYSKVELYLDRDTTGITQTEKLLFAVPQSMDMSKIFNGNKDLNEFLIQQKMTSKFQYKR